MHSSELRINVFIMAKTLDSISDIFLHIPVQCCTFVDSSTMISVALVLEVTFFLKSKKLPK